MKRYILAIVILLSLVIFITGCGPIEGTVVGKYKWNHMVNKIFQDDYILVIQKEDWDGVQEIAVSRKDWERIDFGDYYGEDK